GGIRPHLAVTISLDDLKHGGARATGDPTFGDALSAAAVRLLACDAGIIPVILGSESEPPRRRA
ncbi:MAG TPA: HNH endonuclease, partial [Kribbellaceae bacterium]